MYSKKEQSKEKKPFKKDEIHPRAQTKWEELRLRGFIGKTNETKPKPQSEQKEKENEN